MSKESSKVWYEANKEKHKAKTKLWQQANPEKVKAIQRKSRSSNDPRRLLRLVKARARVKNIDFNLEISDMVIPAVCPYLKTPFVYGDKNTGMSVDRIDNSKGYIKGNIEIISVQANRMKNIASFTELVNFSKEVLRRWDIEDL
jgi:hypothetical protein